MCIRDSYEGSIEKFGDALNQLYQDEILRKELSTNALERFENRFTWEGKSQQISMLYQTILQGKKQTQLIPEFL